jgi:hypothetical protein
MRFSFAANADYVATAWQALAKNVHRSYLLIRKPYSVERLVAQ